MVLKIKYSFGSTPLEQDELDQLIPWHILTQKQLNEWEMYNVSKWYDWMKNTKADMFTEEFCRKLHKKMFGETWLWAWLFRKSGKNIGCPAYQIYDQLKNVLDNAKYCLEHNIFTIHELAIRFHHELVKIHPFTNWNWRLSRAMADLLLSRKKAIPLSWWEWSSLIEPSTNRNQYINSLRKADNWDYFDLIKFCKPK